jgi:hypothetical protein
VAAAATSPMALSNAALLACEGLLKPLSLRTNCSEARGSHRSSPAARS